jgi:hypothetical protein
VRLLEETVIRRLRERPGFDAALADAWAQVGAGELTVPQAVHEILDAAGETTARTSGKPGSIDTP